MSIGPGGSTYGVTFADPNSPPADYPINKATGQSRYITAIQPAPTIKDCDPTRLQALSASGMLVVMMDGSVRLVATNTSLTTLVRAIIPNDGLQLGADW
jgi:hypothetical protein